MTQETASAIAAPLQWTKAINASYFINSAAISGDGSRVVAGTFFHSYGDDARMVGSLANSGTFGTYCFDRTGNQLWADTFDGFEGVYWTAISADGSIAASGGWFSQQPTYQGFVRAYSAADGAMLLNYNPPDRVNTVVLSADGQTLVAAADNVYLFQQQNGAFSATPAIYQLGANNTAQSVSVSADGQWIVAADYNGKVYLIENNNGQIGSVYTWSSPVAKTLHSVAMAAGGEWFTVGGNDSHVYLFSVAAMIANQQPTGNYQLNTGGSIYGVAISADGTYLSALGNSGETGVVYALQNNGGVPAQLWRQTTLRNPNLTSLDAAGKYVSVADGHPDGTPGNFYLFDRLSGNQLWVYNTDNMSWAMQISADASGIIAGSDTGSVYYFTPQ